MPSRDPFNFASSPSVASIPCGECGHNMQCVRREAIIAGERQSFACAECGNTSRRVVGLQDSDEAIQAAVERSLGIDRAAI